MKKFEILTFAFLLCTSPSAQDVDTLDLLDESDVEVLLDSEEKNKLEELSADEEVDDLESLKNDIGESIFIEEEKAKAKKERESEEKEEAKKRKESDISLLNSKNDVKRSGIEIFDVGPEEKELLEVSRFIEGKIPEKEWDEIAVSAKQEKYVVQEGDWLWKISQRLFGSGFYYSKIWSLNPHITNPHEIEPGMTLVFSTGNTDQMPEVKLGDFNTVLTQDQRNRQLKESHDFFDFRDFGSGVKPTWIDQRKKLIDQGIYFQYASGETYEDLVNLGQQSLENEYQKYEPPVPDIVIQEPTEEYDTSGFDKTSKIVFDVKQGFFLNTFVTSNIVRDLGELKGTPKENVFVSISDIVYVKFDKDARVKPGDQYSVYVPGGKISHQSSDRIGYKYTIVGQIRLRRKINHLWECEVFDVSGIVRRGDRITVYTPKIAQIFQTYNKRNIEAAVVASFQDTANGLSYGDVVYLDRGRADGVEMGTVFEVFSFRDRGTEKKLTNDPTYKIGEVSVISLTDNFATALVSKSNTLINLGSVAVTKTEEQQLLSKRLKSGIMSKNISEIEAKSLDELDVELNLDDINKDLLDKADQVQLTEDELEELEREEREKSIIRDHERDLNELEKLEGEIVEAEASINEAKVDEDKFIEQQDLNAVERRQKGVDPNSFESLNDIEDEVGLKYLDQDLNAKENPYGLTEFDLEEIDELLNTDQQ